MLSTPPLKRAQMKYQAKNVQLPLPMEVLMPKAKPVSFHPLSFDQAIDALISETEATKETVNCQAVETKKITKFKDARSPAKVFKHMYLMTRNIG